MGLVLRKEEVASKLVEFRSREEISLMSKTG